MKKVTIFLILSFVFLKATGQDYYSDSLSLHQKAVLDTLPIIG